MMLYSMNNKPYTCLCHLEIYCLKGGRATERQIQIYHSFL